MSQQRDPFALCGVTLDGKYRVDEIAGRGGFGVVYRGEHEAFREPIAIKCLTVPASLEPAEQEALLEELRREGAVLHRLSKKSPAIVQALDVGAITVAGRWVPYLVMEWLPGRALREHLAAHASLSVDEAAALLAPVARALATAHRQGVAHRDIKPDNLFVTGEGDIKILDFGIAKVVSQGVRFTASPHATSQDKPRAFTPTYGAPEQFHPRHGATGPWTDVFALALVFVECVTGEPVLRGTDPTQLYVEVTDAERPTPRTRGVATSEAVEAVLSRALAVEPAARFPDAGSFWDALEAALRGEMPRALSESPAAPGEVATGEYIAEAGLGVASDPPPPVVPENETGREQPTVDSGAPTVLADTPDTEREYERFQTRTIALARDGVPLTVANVVAGLDVDPARARAFLGRMADEGELSAVEAGSATWAVPGLRVDDSVPARLRRGVAAWGRLVFPILRIDPSRPPAIPPNKRKSVPVALIAGLVIPIFGMWYASPFWVVPLAALVFVAISEGLRSVPVAGSVLAGIVYAAMLVFSATLGGAYAWHYNQTGRRTRIRDVDPPRLER